MFEKILLNSDGDYEIKSLIDGQTVKITFWRIHSIYDRYAYSLYLRILDKKKKDHINSLSIKNKVRIGIKGLLYAKEQLINFIDFIKELKNINSVDIYIFWEDSKRKRVYERGLRNLGFKYQMLNLDNVNNKCLHKKF